MPIIILSLVLLLSSGLIQGRYLMLNRTKTPFIAGRLYACLNGSGISSVLALNLFFLISFLLGTLYYLHQAKYLGQCFPSLPVTAAARWLFFPVIAAFVIFPLALCFYPYFEGLNQNQLAP